MKHTNGPWKLLKFSDDERYVVTNTAGNKRIFREIAEIHFGFSEKAETEQHANAKLIAAAPELLEALTRLITTFHPDTYSNHGTCGCTLCEARAAIAKATEAKS